MYEKNKVKRGGFNNINQKKKKKKKREDMYKKIDMKRDGFKKIK